MALQCNHCKEEKPKFAICLDCRYRICMDCAIELYQTRTSKAPFPGTCGRCNQSFDQEILRYLRDNPEDAPIFVNISLRYSPWDTILKEILRGDLKGQRLFEEINEALGTRVVY